MKCLTCQNIATQTHHVIFRSQGGSENKCNKIGLCEYCHNEIHHGIHTERRQEILNACYEYIKPNLSKCWKGKIKPKIVNILEENY
jgi:5-methylcytosine-specific restriction endonuclease McrA